MNDNLDAFAGKVALVTGAGSGIGRAAARQLARRGAAHVVFADVDAQAAAAAAEGVEQARCLGLDVADSTRVDDAVNALVAERGRLDVVVHAAGIDDPVAKQRLAEAVEGGHTFELIGRLSDETWQRMIAVNLTGAFHVLRAAVRHMCAQKSGSVVLVGSSSSFDAPVSHPHYAAAKAGVHALAQSVAKEVIAHDVRVNVLAPGPTDTAMARRTPEILKQAAPGSSVSRYATADEMAALALFLAGDEAVNVVGGVLLANGGRFTA
ncbi:3-oxoacyl-[acyl-carrier protein] reductase [Saccharopolyspora erythraea NRRL 2338]|uniref:3-oxoacyl-ACP reductase FabG n=1 Tax=Saccharopolyspora erythraea TaxID=1836 RepID=A0ABP3P191_SACER|nr:SDR family NAD(P)-dependent oxidoreductase [Saccharopolyspora erythraea]EQD83530.1 oxidoreductase [Saccharopolyspora erythraea D]PFG95759.1 3-oxoacyl-[acyl-carrier protein] reductase [Saccharopolyspora erythraea NRRL 2338]QRK92349.1 SDR family NAD(P)-dependent oxidoreductase [Saccharopolyspora erythraea]